MSTVDAIDVYDKLRADAYAVKLPYPPKPEIPAVLKKRAGELTDAEAANIPALRAEHKAALEECERQRKAYGEEEGRLHKQFWDDLHSHYGITDESDPFVIAMDGLAYASGHAHGHSEVASHFDDLVPLYEIYRKASVLEAQTK